MRGRSKKDLWILISKSMNKIHRLHVLSIINILIDEMIKDLLAGKSIKIKNFGTFKLNSLKPKKIVNLLTNRVKFAQKTKSLRFRMSKSFYKIMNAKSLKIVEESVKLCEENQDQ